MEPLTPLEVVGAYEAHKMSLTRSGSVANANWVTTLAHRCEAYAYYNRTVKPSDRKAIEMNLAMIFAEGNDQARMIKRDLIDAGFDIEGEEGQMSWPKYQITGRKDFRIRKSGTASVRVEAKSCSPFTFEGINSVADLRHHRSEWVRKWDRQVCLYMVLESVEMYWLLMKNKSSGKMKIIPYTLGDEELNIANEMISKAERVNKLIQIGEMPSRDQKIEEPDTCGECEFFTTCLPNLNFGIGAISLDAERVAELSEMLDRRAEMEPTAKAFKNLDEEIKEECKALTAGGSDSETLAIGDWQALVAKSDRKEYTVKAQKITTVKFQKLSGLGELTSELSRTVK